MGLLTIYHLLSRNTLSSVIHSIYIL